MYKCIHGLAPEYLKNETVLQRDIMTTNNRRHHMNVYVPFPRKEMFRNKFSYVGAKNWNDLPGDIKDCKTLNTFKIKLKKLING